MSFMSTIIIIVNLRSTLAVRIMRNNAIKMSVLISQQAVFPRDCVGTGRELRRVMLARAAFLATYIPLRSYGYITTP